MYLPGECGWIHFQWASRSPEKVGMGTGSMGQKGFGAWWRGARATSGAWKYPCTVQCILGKREGEGAGVAGFGRWVWNIEVLECARPPAKGGGPVVGDSEKHK